MRLQAIRIIYGSTHHHRDSTLPLCCSQNELGVTSARVTAFVASMSIHSTRACVVSTCRHVFRQFHRLRSKLGQMINATAINAVPVLEDVYAGTTNTHTAHTIHNTQPHTAYKTHNTSARHITLHHITAHDTTAQTRHFVV